MIKDYLSYIDTSCLFIATVSGVFFSYKTIKKLKKYNTLNIEVFVIFNEVRESYTWHIKLSFSECQKTIESLILKLTKGFVLKAHYFYGQMQLDDSMPHILNIKNITSGDYVVLSFDVSNGISESLIRLIEKDRSCNPLFKLECSCIRLNIKSFKHSVIHD